MINLHYDDSIFLARHVSHESVRLAIVDPPYFQVSPEKWDNQWKNSEQYCVWFNTIMSVIKYSLVPGGLVYIFGQVGKKEQAFLQIMDYQSSHSLNFHDLIIWDRVVGYSDRQDSFTNAYEMILVLRKSGAEPYFNKDIVREPYTEKQIESYLKDNRYKDVAARKLHLKKGKYARNIWSLPSLKGNSSEKCGHPTQKPLEVIQRIVLSSSEEGDLILDPFMGSGTTGVICAWTNRDFIGIEKDQNYYEIAYNRITKVCPETISCD